MSVTAKDQYEDLLIERNELRRELESYKKLMDTKVAALKCDLSDAQSESAEARGNVEKALRELSEEVAKRHKAKAVVTQLVEALESVLPSPDWDDSIQAKARKVLQAAKGLL